jgi:hypothetical protein
MAQPTFTDIFGINSSLETMNGVITLSLADLQEASLDTPDYTKPLNVLAAIIAKANIWLEANTDLSVNAGSSMDVIAPINRNNADKTEFTYQIVFYGPYDEPIFDPDVIQV